MRVFPALCFVLLTACAATIPKAELDRCTLGMSDGNDAMTTRQGAACTMVAKRLAADEQPGAALGYARKACDLQDARGCEEYLALVRGQSSVTADELSRARSAGEKACSGMVIAMEGAADARPLLCARTAELFADVQPSSKEDAGRLFARACKLGDDRSCPKARALGFDPSDHVVVSPRPSPNAPAGAQPLPAPGPRPVTASTAPLPPTPACHEMRSCVTLDVTENDLTNVVGAITNHCDRAVACSWCPAHRDQVDKAACHNATLNPGEKRAGRDAGLWYAGYDSMAYDCMEAGDPRGCLGI